MKQNKLFIWAWLLTCVLWTGCDDSVTVRVSCEEQNATLCVNNKVYICIDHTWQNPQDCVAGCDDAKKTCLEKCKESQERCSDDKNNIEVCQSDGTWQSHPCGEGQKCDIENVKCEPESDDVECTESDNNCIDSTVLQVCESGKLVTKNCHELGCNFYEKKCNDESIVSACQANAECSMDGKSICNDNGQFEICDQGSCEVINGVAKCEFCTPGQNKCDDEGKILKSCNSEGEWSASECLLRCATYDGVSKCVECETDICDGEKIRRCYDGELKEPVSCNNDNVCYLGECTGPVIQCTNDGLGYKVYRDKEWVESPCPAGMYCDNNFLKERQNNEALACIECTPREQKCTKGEIFQTCDDNGRWGAPEWCAGECEGITECGECIDGSYVCMPEKDGKVKLLQCKSNEWTEYRICEHNNMCYISESNDFAGCVSCIPGSGFCEDKKLKKCNEHGNGYNEIDCGDDKSCDPYIAECIQECDKGSRRCVVEDGKDLLQMCENKTWKTIDTCEENEVCNSFVGICQSAPSQTYCMVNDDTVFVVSAKDDLMNGQYVKECDDKCYRYADGLKKTASCDDPKRLMSYLSLNKKGEWSTMTSKSPKSCEGGFSCVNSNLGFTCRACTVNQCVEGRYQCGEEEGKVQYCLPNSNGLGMSWYEASCPTGKKCKESEDGVQCG